MEGVVDTNILVASLVESDINHENAKSILNKLERWYLPTIVVHEFVWFLKSQKLNIGLVLPFLLHEKSLIAEVKREDIIFAVEKCAKKPFNYNDYLVASVALRLKKKLITFDEELERQFKKLR